MDPVEISNFKKKIGELLVSDQEDCMYEDVMLSLVKNRTSNFPNINILNELLPTQFPVVIAHKPFDKNPVKQTSEQSTFFDDYTPTEKLIKKQSVSSDVGGSPLKLQSFADFSTFEVNPHEFAPTKAEETVDPEDLKFGIPLDFARKLSSLFNRCVNSSHKELLDICPSFLCFCDGHDRKRTANIYTEVVMSDTNEYLGLKSVFIGVIDPITNNKHIPDVRKIDFSRRQLTCKATYDILNDTKEVSLDVKDNFQFKGALVVDVVWTKQNSITGLLQAPPPEATTTIMANVFPGSTRSPTYTLCVELSVLKNLVEGLNSSKITWIPDEKQKLNIMKSVKELFENLKLGDAYLKDEGKNTNKKDNQDEEISKSAINEFNLDKRDNYDFTDHLWKILFQCTEYQELTDPLKYVFTALSNGELQPMVHRGNNTMVAQLVRDSFSGKLRIPNLAGLYPVELLVEIGIEKLKQDYMHAFLSQDLVTRESLDYFLKTEGDFNTQLTNLEKMHSIIEMICFLKFFLNIPLQSLGSIAREMIHHYEKHPVSENHVFKFIVPTSSVIKNLENCPPSTWQLESAKFVENVKETVTYLLTSDPPLKHLHFSNIDANMNTKDEMNETNITKVDESVCPEKMKRLYYLVKKVDGISVLV